MRSILLVLVLATVAHAAPDDPKVLAAAGLAHERAGEWIEARQTYEKLGAIKGHESEALYLEAWSALQAGDDTAALELAKKAVDAPGPFHDQARMVYGDALFHRGEYKRAKDVFIALRDRSKGDAKQIAANKIAAVDHIIEPNAAPAITHDKVEPMEVGDNPTELMSAGQMFEKGGNWSDAGAMYKRLATHKGYEGDGAYLEARTAFQMNDNDRTRLLAEKAAKLPGKYVFEAKVLFGDAIFRSGDHARAKTIYLALIKLKANDAALVETFQKKVIACNRQLKLPERDGL